MLRKICNIFIAFIVLCALIMVAMLGIPLVTGSQLYAVQTASMEPTYPIGSIVVVGQVQPGALAVGDVITFEVSGFDSLVTHRVIRVDADNHQVYTQGDNNDNPDFYPVPFEGIVGRVQYGIPLLGRVVSGIRTPGGILALLWIAVIIVILLLLPDMADKRKALQKEKRRPRRAAAQPADGIGQRMEEPYGPAPRPVAVPPAQPAAKTVYRAGAFTTAGWAEPGKGGT